MGIRKRALLSVLLAGGMILGTVATPSLGIAYAKHGGAHSSSKSPTGTLRSDKALKDAAKAIKDAAKADLKAARDAAKAEKKAARDAAKSEKKSSKDLAKAEKKSAKDTAKADKESSLPDDGDEQTVSLDD